MQKILFHLWFDKEAKEAAAFYTKLFPNSEILNTQTITDTPSGDCEIVNFKILGMPFMAISAGPLFKFNPAISFMVNFDPSQDPEAKERIDEVWAKLSEGGKVLMPLQQYPFSERYGWVEDRYGVSWQLILTKPEGEERPLLLPALLFNGEVCGKAEEASDFYLSIFENSKRGTMARYPAGMEPDQEGTVMFTDFRLQEQWFVAMDSGHEHGFVFNEAISFMLYCETQEEIDQDWEKLLAGGGIEQPCGWLKDRYGVSWQVVPSSLDQMMSDSDKEAVNRVTQAFLQMKKFDLAILEQAYRGELL